MKTQIALLFGFALTLQACKKEEPVIPEDNTPTGNPTQNFQLTSTVGSYWIYQWYDIDSNGLETPTNQLDSVFVVADSAMNADDYISMVSERINNGNSYPIYLKDSSGYIVRNDGRILYSYNNFTSAIASGSEPNWWDWETRMYNEMSVTVPCGTYGCIEARDTYFDPNGGPVTSCGTTTVVLNRFYAPNIGLIKERTAYYTMAQDCSGFLEKRLLRYHIN